MESSETSVSLDDHVEYATQYAERKARQLVGHFGFTASDREDIVQDLLLEVVTRWPQFDSERGTPHVFIRRVIWASVSKLIRDKRALKRQFDYAAGPIDDEAEQEVTTNFCTGLPRRSDHELFDLATDVKTVLAKLPAELRDICERLQWQTISEISRELDIPRTTVNRRVKKLRRTFEEAGLHHYFELELG